MFLYLRFGWMYMHQISQYDAGNMTRPRSGPEAVVAAPTLLAVLWRRRWLLLATIAGCGFIGGIYIAVATRVYSASAKVLVQQNEPETLNDAQTHYAQSETYVQTQADVFQSSPVLKGALDGVHYQNLKTFASAGPDPIAWVRKSNVLKIEAAKKSDVIVVSMDGPYPAEAADFANAVVAEYIHQSAVHKQTIGNDMLKALQVERADLVKQRNQHLAAMDELKKKNRALSLNSDRGNTAFERTITLTTSLTTAQLKTLELRSEKSALEAALSRPDTLHAYVVAQQFKSKDSGDHEYDELRSQLNNQMLALSTASSLAGEQNSRVRTLEATVEGLRARIAEKEKQIAMAHLVALQTDLAASEANEKSLAVEEKSQRDQAVDQVGPAATEYAKHEADSTRLLKQSETLDQRIAQVQVNELGSAPLNVQVLEAAVPPVKPVKPNKMLIGGGALMFGWVLGIGLALATEWRDACFRDPKEVNAILGTTVLGAVPRINARLSSVARGQILFLDSQSPSAEAYRSIRTSLNLGSFRDAKTILVSSPTPGEGKSTSASNLAIAFAQAGLRTLLVDCDMREPVQHMIFETDGSVGITSVVAGEEKLRNAIQATRVESLYLLPCGPVPANPAELVAGKRFGQLMRSLIDSFDRIVIDSPPVSMFADGRIMAASADATLLVLRMNHSPYRMASLAMEELHRVGANVIGAIANDVPMQRGNGYSYYRGANWQEAYSPKRVMASVLSKEQEASRVAEPTPPTGLTVAEPDWNGSNEPKPSVIARDHANTKIALSAGSPGREW